MTNLWYKVAEYYGESNNRGQQLDPSLWTSGFNNNAHVKERRENYWKNLSSIGADKIVAYNAIHGNWKRLIHKTCAPELEKNNLKDTYGRTYDVLKPVSFQELRQKQTGFGSKDRLMPECLYCNGTIVPSRPHSEKECFSGKNLTEYAAFRIDKGKCSQTTQFRPEGWFHHICQHNSGGSCINHGGFDPKDAFPQGHISDEQVKAYGTPGDLEVLLGAEAEYRVRNNLPINLGGRNK